MSSNINFKLTDDLEYVLLQSGNIWHHLSYKTVFLTGGTGFFGKWLIESFIYINTKLALNAKLIILTRNKMLFFQSYRHIKETEVSFIEGDVKDFIFPENAIDFIIHAATETSASLNADAPLVMLDTITRGTRRVLDLAVEKKVAGLLFTSSGAVYGRQPENITRIKETDSFFVDINNPGSAYAEGKRLAETYCSIYFQHYGVPVKIARCFAFVGPFLPLNKHFAIGNFISNALNDEDIVIKGDGSPFRSYLYAADLTIWLWTILFKGQSNYPYNVGSDEDYNLKDIAGFISKKRKQLNLRILTPREAARPVERYVPNVDRAKKDMGLKIATNLDEAINKTMEFYEFLNNK